MNRCISRLAIFLQGALAFVLAASSTFFLAWPALAQYEEPPPAVRQFPRNVQRGEMLMLMAPEIVMDGRPERLTMGSRIRDANNHLVLPGQIVNQKFLVNYVRENGGPVHLVWILNSEEAKARLPGTPRSFWERLTGAGEVPADEVLTQ